MLADVITPVIGADFLAHFDLSVSPKWQTMFFHGTGQQVTNAGYQPPPPILAAVELPKNLDPQVADLLKKFPAILRPGTAKPMPTHRVEHVIETEGRPVFAKARRLDPLKLQIVQKEFEELEAAALSATQTARGLPPSTWSRKRMVHSDHAVITAG